MMFSYTKSSVIFLLLILLVTAAKAEEIEAKIQVISGFGLHIEGKIINAENYKKSWTFSQNFPAVSGLGERVENFKVLDKNNSEISVKTFIPGEFESAEPGKFFSYDIKFKRFEKETDAAHVSWLTESHGLLNANDLFSLNLGHLSAKITFEIPNELRIYSSENNLGLNIFSISKIEKAVFLVGKNIREHIVVTGKTSLSLATVGEWQFTDNEAIKISQDIFSEYLKIFGEAAISKAVIFLLPFPQQTNLERWRAETRGSTVTVISAPTTFKSNALNRLQEQLRHELFHLWLPNSLNLSGNYDWFFEGFTFYQALKTGVKLNQIRFSDFLSTIERGYDFTEILTRRQNYSLLEASEKRWVNSGDFIYAKGTVVAFLCDAILLRESKGKKDTEKIFREIFQQHRFPNVRENGNEAILRILKQNTALIPVIEKYVEGNNKIDWQSDLKSFGLEVTKNSGATQIKVSDKLNGRQKDLLDKLGYNQWRKILQK